MNNVMQLIHDVPAIFYGSIFIFSLIIGSFLNVVIYRLPVMMKRSWRSQCVEFFPEAQLQEPVDVNVFNLVVPRSRCSKCNQTIGMKENIPVVSWFILKGKCKYCRAKISARYPAIELLTAILSVVVTLSIPLGWPLLFALILTWILIVLSFIDIDTMLLPDEITLPLLWSGLIVNFWGMFANIQAALLGAIFGYLILWVIFWVFKLLTGKEGMGYGDFKLFAALGAWFGWQALPAIILVSTLTGAVISIGIILFSQYKRDKSIPFGPYLSLAGWVYLLYGNEITQAYLKMILYNG
ncbi:MAG: prepilin peptidase [Psychromonas sp.]|nr:prepilin peptidase [Psychromonas sp.]